MNHLKGKFTFVAGLLLLLSVSACLGGVTVTDPNAAPSAPLGHEILLQGTGTLTCSQACLDRGQCGALDDGRNVILLSTAAPNVSGHDRIMLENSAVTLQPPQNVLLRKKNAPDTQYAAPFYYAILNEDPNRQGWIAGWCIQQAAAQ